MTTLIELTIPFVVDVSKNPDNPGVVESEIDEIIDLAKEIKRIGAAATVGTIAEGMLVKHPWRFNQWFAFYGALKTGSLILPLRSKLAQAEYEEEIESAIRERSEKKYNELISRMKKDFFSELKR